MCIDVQGWALRPGQWSEDFYRLVRYFLICSPAFDTTHMASSFIDSLNIRRSTLAEQYLCEIEKVLGARISFYDDTKGVEESIQELGGEPWIGNEDYLVCTRSEKESLTNEVKLVTDYDQNASSQLEKGANKTILRRFFEVDAVYRHMRNALAHGCFRIVGEGDAARLFFFNVNTCGNLSAYGLLSFQNLEGLYQLNCSIAEREL